MDFNGIKGKKRITVMKEQKDQWANFPVVKRHLNLETLPGICLQRIFSFLDYNTVSQLRRVSNTFNKACKLWIKYGCKVLEEKLEKEIKWAEENVLAPSYQRASFDTAIFFNCIYKVLILDCKFGYERYLDLDEYFFVAGKVLDEAANLVRSFSYPTPLPFVIEDHYLPSTHPFFAPFYQLCIRATEHYANSIGRPRAIAILKNGGKKQGKYWEKIKSDIKLSDIIKKKAKEIEIKVKEQKRRIGYGEQMNREFSKAIQRVNRSTIDLTEETIEMVQEVDQLIKCRERSMTTGNFTSHIKVHKAMKRTNEELNLGTLPSICIQHIVSHLKYEKVSQLRSVCKVFNEACKTVLTEGVEEVLTITRRKHEVDIMQVLMYCRDIYRCEMGGEYYFIAGKLLDAAVKYYIHPETLVDDGNVIVPLVLFFMDYVKIAVAHFQCKIGPKYFPRAGLFKNKDFITFAQALRFGYKKKYDLNLEKVEKTTTEQEVIIKKINQKNTIAVKIYSDLKKNLKVLNEEVSVKTLILNGFKNGFLCQI